METGDISRLRGIRKTFLRNISNQERRILEILEAEPSDHVNDSLIGLKNSFLEKIEKVKSFDEKILDILDGGEMESELEENLNRLDRTHELLAKIDSFLNVDKSASSEKFKSQSNENDVSTKIEVKLPKLEICKFNGDITAWQSFWDQFDSAIHSNERISDINKFTYLQSYLCEEARNIISGLSPTSTNYREAVDILRKRYGNTQVLISSYMKKFVLLPKIASDNDVKGLRNLLDQVETSVRNLRSLEVETDSYGSLLVPLVNEKLPNELRVNIAKNFENDIWDINIMIAFLRKEVEAKERSYAVGTSFEHSGESEMNDFSSSALYAQNRFKTSQARITTCVFCDKTNHSANKCFKITDTKARKFIVKQKRLCFLCLQDGHLAQACKLKNYTCNKCGGRHNIAICTFSDRKNKKFLNSTEETSQTGSNIANNKNNVLLQTATVSLSNQGNKRLVKNVQVLFDSGSQRSYISEEVRQRLKLPTLRKENLLINTFGSQNAVSKIVDVVSVAIMCPNKNPTTIECLCTSMICADITNQNIRMVSASYPHLKNLTLADSSCESNKKIDVLIGADAYYRFVYGNVIRGKENEPIAIESCFGWVLTGYYGCLSSINFNNTTHLLRCTTQNITFEQDKPFQKSIKTFLNDEFHSNDIERDELKERYLTELENNLNFANNRYEVKLPFTEDPEVLPDNYSLSEKRVKNLVTSLKRKPSLLKEYDLIIKEYLEEGILEEVTDMHKASSVHYLPHRPVVKENRETTKVRIVFDASANVRNQPSLNDILDPGPCLLPYLFDILLRFRIGKVALVADIKKAFLQILIEKEDRDFLRLLWFKDILNGSAEPAVLRFTRLVFGLNPSPFFLNGVLKIHLKKFIVCPDLIREINRLLKDLYVDDVTSSFNNKEEGAKFYEVSKSCLLSGSFELRKWVSNDINLQRFINSRETKTERSENFRKVLGVNWHIKTDEFCFEFDEILNLAKSLPPTKRNILKISAKLFDPLGLISPVILQAKLIFKYLCLNKFEWDTRICGDTVKPWDNWMGELKKLGRIFVSRHVLCSCSIKKVELHGFCDSSGVAYCACIYVKSICCTSKVSLWVSKNRLAPSHSLSIPRLELLACLLLSKLVVTVLKAIEGEVSVSEVFCWSDSQVALWWVKQCHKRWNIWVQNRVEVIRKNTSPSTWYHVPSSENPADVSTRSISLFQFTKSIWFTGPQFLSCSRESWPFQHIGDIKVSDEDLEEKVPQTLVNVAANGIGSVIDCQRYSSLEKLLRITAYVLRFVKNISSKRSSKGISDVEELSVDEIDNSLKYWIRYDQTSIVSNAKFEKMQSSLKLFYDEEKILRVRTRISGIENFSYDKKFPILLNNASYFTNLIVLQLHKKVCHNGVNSTLNSVRSRYWIVKGRQTVKKILHSCFICKYVQGKTLLPPGTPCLPTFRVTCNHSFENVGIDFAGPIYFKNVPDGSTKKSYILLFTCGATRAVHIEITVNLNVNSLILALRRFAARHGKPVLFVSDNFKSFKAPALKNYLRNNGIKWNFILERSPWWGGFYERLIGLTKNCLKKVLGKAIVTLEELLTVSAEVECAINSRPLTYIDDDPNTSTLTPNHLVFGRNLSEKCFAGNTEEVDSSQTRDAFHRQKLLMKHFRKRFENEYTSALQERHFYYNPKIGKTRKNLIGDVALIKEENVPRMKWRKGKVVKLIRGTDNSVRGLELAVYQPKLKRTTVLKRPLQAVVPFEVVERNDDAAADPESPPSRPRREAAKNADAIRRASER